MSSCLSILALREKAGPLCPGADLQESSGPGVRIQLQAAEARVKCWGLWQVPMLFETFAAYGLEGK